MIKRVDSIDVNYETVDEGNYTNHQVERFTTPEPMDAFFHWLIVEGFYDDISATKRFNLTEEVIKRMKGKK